jgi:hypothetical protein
MAFAVHGATMRGVDDEVGNLARVALDAAASAVRGCDAASQASHPPSMYNKVLPVPTIWMILLHSISNTLQEKHHHCFRFSFYFLLGYFIFGISSRVSNKLIRLRHSGIIKPHSCFQNQTLDLSVAPNLHNRKKKEPPPSFTMLVKSILVLATAALAAASPSARRQRRQACTPKPPTRASLPVNGGGASTLLVVILMSNGPSKLTSENSPRACCSST